MRNLRLTLLVLTLAAAGALAAPRLAHAAAPVLDPIGNRTVAEGQALVITVTATGGSLTYFGPVLPPGATFDAPTHVFTWTPTFSQAGTYPGLSFLVSDGTATDDETIAITVTDVDRPPVAVAGGPYAGTVGAPVRFASTTSSDPEGTGLTSTWQFGDGSTAAGALVDHVYAAAGAYAATLTVSDGTASASVGFPVTITSAVPGGNGSPAAHGPAVRLRLSPEVPTVDADASVGFAAVAADAVGVEWDVTTTTTFSVNDPRGLFDGTVYHAGKVGTWTAQGDYGGLVATTTVAVTSGALNRIVVNPSSNPEEVPVGGRRTFEAAGFDADSNPVEPAGLTWDVTASLGTIAGNGTFTATSEGSGTVVAQSSAVSGTAAIQIVPKAAAAAPTEPSPPPTKRISAASTGETGAVLGTETEGTTEPAPAESANATSTPCSNPLHWWGWLGVLFAYYLVLVGVMYATRRVRGMVFWTLPVALTAAVLWAFFLYRCDNFYPWFPWLAVIGGLIIALFRPLPPEPRPPPSPQPAML